MRGAGYDAPVPLRRDQLDPDLSGALSTQSYGGGTSIEGLRVVQLTEHVDESGSLVELARLGSAAELVGLEGFTVRQANWSRVASGAIKAWHLHLKQDDLWFVPPWARLLAGLHDARRDSPTSGLTQRMVLGAGRAQLVRVPSGVAHGVANLWDQDADLIYLVDQAFDPADPDEHRLPWDHLGADFWTLKKG